MFREETKCFEKHPIWLSLLNRRRNNTITRGVVNTVTLLEDSFIKTAFIKNILIVLVSKCEST